MKFEVKWTAKDQLIMSDYVESLNDSGARSQVVAMRSDIPGFSVIGTYAIRDENSTSETSSSVNSGSSDFDFSSNVTLIGISLGCLVSLYGLLSLPTGIVAFFIGGAIGFASWKLGCWLSDKGW